MNGKLEKFKPGKLFTITLFFILIPLAYYIFFSVPEQKEQLTNRYLRFIAGMSDRFESKGRNIKTVIESETNNILKALRGNREEQDKIIDEINYLEKKGRFDADCMEILNNREAQDRWFFAFLIHSVKRSLKRIPDLDVTCYKAGEWNKSLHYEPGNIEYDLDMSYDRGSAALALLIIFKTTGEEFPYRIRAGMKISDFTGSIFKGEGFEEVFLLNEDKKTIHRWGRLDDEAAKSSLKIFDFAPLIDTASAKPGKKADDSKDKAGDDDKEKTGDKKKSNASGAFTRVIDIKAAGSDYKFFLQPIPLTFISEGNKNWFVGGLLPVKTFDLRSRKISLNAMIVFLFILSLILVGYPTVKLLLTDAADRLKTRDVFLVILSLSIGVPMVIYSFFSAAYYFTGHNTTLKLKEIANQVHDDFTSEIDRAHRQLHILVEDKDRVMKRKTHSAEGIDREKGNEILAAYEKDRLVYPYFDMAFIMDIDGKQTYKCIVNKDNISFNDVSSRDYFKGIKDEAYWFTSSGKPIMLEPVYSKSTGRYEINICIPLKDTDPDVFAAGMSFRPLSVIQPVLPHGYAFAVINHKGKVLFHSDPRLNSYENFFVESTAGGALKAAIFARAECREKITYHGARWDMYSRPMGDIPWDIIVLKNRDIVSTKYLTSLLIAMMDNLIYIFFLGLLLICFDLYILLREKISGKAAGRQPIKFRLLWPSDRLRYKYNELALLNLLIFVILLLHLFFTEAQPAYFLVTPFIVSILIFSIMMKSIYHEGTRANSKRPARLSYLFSAIGLPLLVLGLIYIVEKGVFLSFSISNTIVLLPVVFYLVVLFIPQGKEKKWLKGRLSAHHSYTLFLYSYLLLAIVYPGLYMIATTSQDISKVAIKHDQLMLARNYSAWENRVKKEYPGRADFIKKDEMNISKNEPFKNPWTYTLQSDTLKIDLERYIGFAQNVQLILPIPVLNKTIEKEKQARDLFLEIEGGVNPAFFTVRILKFLNMLMPVNLHYAEGIMSILPESTKEKPQKQPLVWADKPGADKIHFKYHEKSQRAKPIHIESKILKLKRDTKEKIIAAVCNFFIVFFLTIVLCAVVRFILKIVFPAVGEISSHKKSLFFNKEETMPGKYIVLGKAVSIDHHCIDCKDSDFLKQLDENSFSDGAHVYVTHFDYGRHDAEENAQKLELLERLVFSCDVNITVFSNFEPLEYFTLTKPAAKDKKDKKNNDKSEEKGCEKNMSNRWRRILSRFEYRYTKEEAGENVKAPAGLQGRLKEFVENECANSEYLGNVKNRVFEEFKGMKSEDISLSMLKERIYRIAKPVYDQIWRTSTAEEKLVLVQLAQEGLLNFKNKAPIRHLLNRGVIRYPPILFLSKTFKEYTRSVDDLDKILHDEQVEEDNRWKRFKRPFFFLVTFAVLFLVVTQPDIMKSWMVIIPAFTAGVPAATRFFDRVLSKQQYNLED